MDLYTQFIKDTFFLGYNPQNYDLIYCFYTFYPTKSRISELFWDIQVKYNDLLLSH